MKSQYTGNYRTRLSKDVRDIFKKYALEEGSVIKVHDMLIREYVSKKEQEKKNGDSK